MKKCTFRSRISILLLVITVAILIVILNGIIDSYISPSNIFLSLIFYIPVFAILFSIRYKIQDGRIICKVLGIRLYKVNIRMIYSVSRSYNTMASPASSLKRIEIKFFHKGYKSSLLISPIHEKEFIESLLEVNPEIRISIVDKKDGLRFWDWDI